MGNVTPGALFRLPDGTTGLVYDVVGDRAHANFYTARGVRGLPVDNIAPHIICEPGDGPIRGNDKALADAQARAARMEAERDEARVFLAAVTAGQTEAIHERDALRAEFKADHEALVAKLAAFEDACGLVDPDGAPVEYDLSTLSFRRVGGDAVDHPSHYTATEFEPVVVIEALNPHAHVSFAIKYLARAPHKGRLAEDLKKARWYLLRAVACGVVGRKHPNGRRIAASWSAHYPENLRESAEDAIDYMLAGDYDRSQLLVLACLDAIGGDACTG